MPSGLRVGSGQAGDRSAIARRHYRAGFAGGTDSAYGRPMLRPAASKTAVRRSATPLSGYSVFVLLALLAAAPAHAMHCGSAVISSGDTVDKLLEFCGQPESV